MNSIIFISLTIYLYVSIPNDFIVDVEAKSFRESIVNGAIANEGEAKFMVWVLQKHGLFSFSSCGGTLFKSNKVLTAGHCVYPGQGVVTVSFGTKNRSSSNYEDVKASKVVQHPDYDDINADNDIAVITLSKNITKDSHITYAALEKDEVKVGTKVTIYGWGVTGSDDTYLPERLRKATLTVRRIESTSIIASSDWSLFRKGSTACKGDSGGPMVSSSDEKVVGVASRVKIGCPSGGSNTYTKVSSYFKWINKQ